MVASRVYRQEWSLTTIHEAGHAVAIALHGLPLHKVVVFDEQLGGGWVKVSGRVTHVADDGGVGFPDSDSAALAVCCLAGPAAEARWRGSRSWWLSRSRAWRRACRANTDGDLVALPGLVAPSGLTRAEVEDRARGLVDEWWSTILEVAAAVAVSGCLSGDDVYGMVGGRGGVRSARTSVDGMVSAP